MKLWLVAVVASFVTASAAAAQTTQPTISIVGAAFDESRNRLVVVGGTDTNIETWERSGTTWTRRDVPGPSGREEALMVYDTKRKRMVLFGGAIDGKGLNDTWSWDGTRWQQMASPESPSARISASMVYDRKRDRIVLFGGSVGQTMFNDTWEFDGASWKKRDTPVAPAGRALHGLAYDEARERVVLFGGFHFVGGRPTQFDDTWEWDGTAWRENKITGIGGRDHVWMAYAPDRRAIVLHGGGRPDVGLLGDTWTYDGKAWTKLTDNGPIRGRHRLVYDTQAKRMLLYGGWGANSYRSAELWQLVANTWTIDDTSTSTRVAVVDGFDVPESARYDAQQDVFYVSNVTGHPTKPDNTGFISQIAPNGQVLNRKWIAGGVNGITLNGPKGLALDGDDLWVADINVVRKFNKRTRQQMGLVDLAPLGASFLNDVATGPDGSLFVSDTGFVFDDNGNPSLTRPQRVFRIDRAGTPSVLIEGPELQGPNGVFYDDRNARLLIASIAGKNILSWTAAKGLQVVATGPGGYDGIERLADGRIVVSSMDGKGVFELTGATLTLMVGDVGQTADIGIDTRRNRVVVPRLDNDTIEIHRLTAWPSARHGHTMTFHKALGMSMMFGDADARLWAWDGARWMSFGGPGPEPLKHMRLVYDDARDRLVLYGGAAKTASGDTWEWSNRGWAKVTADGPGPRMGYGMSYDVARSRVVLVGGLTGDRKWMTDTWEWDGRTWTKAGDAGPPARLEAVMMYDPISRRLLYGGGMSTTSASESLTDAWSWDGKSWKQLTEAPKMWWPQLVTKPAGALDTKRQRVVAFGGTNPSTQQPIDELWEWDGKTWRQIKGVPAPRP